jgi:methionine-rich copper-binding protein CopC
MAAKHTTARRIIHASCAHLEIGWETRAIWASGENFIMVKLWLLVAAAGLMLSGPAHGHAKLRASVPSADAQLQTAPKSLSLSFSEDVHLAVLTLTGGGKDIPLAMDRAAPAASQVSVALPALPAGKYQVQWSALSADDGHVTKGTFSFTVLT